MKVASLINFLNLALIALIGFTFSNCSTLTLKKPNVKYENVTLDSVGFTNIRLFVHLVIDNPNDSDIELTNFHYKANINGGPFATGEVKEGFFLKKSGVTKVKVPVDLILDDTLDAYLRVQKDEVIKYRVMGSAEISVFDFPFDRKGELPVPKEDKIIEFKKKLFKFLR